MLTSCSLQSVLRVSEETLKTAVSVLGRVLCSGGPRFVNKRVWGTAWRGFKRNYVEIVGVGGVDERRKRHEVVVHWKPNEGRETK